MADMAIGFVPVVGSESRVRRSARDGTCVRVPCAARSRTRMSEVNPGAIGGSTRSDAADNEDIAVSSAVSTKKRLSEALADAVDEATFELPVGCVPDLAIVYVSASYEDRKVGLNRERLDSVVPQLRELIPGLKHVVGGTVAGVLGADSRGRCTEIETMPAVGVTLARLPGAEIHVFHVEERDLPSLDGPPDSWASLTGGADPSKQPSFILHCNSPFYASGALNSFLSGMDFAYPGSVKVGGVVGPAGPAPGMMYGTLKKDMLTITSKGVQTEGIVGVAITGAVEFSCITTQGVRGVGPVLTVRKMAKKSLVEVDMPTKGAERPKTMAADRALKSIVSDASREDQALLFKNPLLGVVDDESKDELFEGDYLCRQIQGIDQRTGGIALTDDLNPGQRVRFHVRDAAAAYEELESLLNSAKRSDLNRTLEGTVKPIISSMAVSDVTRGIKFFRDGNVDTTTFVKYAPASLLGFFALAEIAPIGGKPTPTYTHESTAVFTVIRRATVIEDAKGFVSEVDTDTDTDEQS